MYYLHEARTAEILLLYGRFIFYVGGISAVKLLDWQISATTSPLIVTYTEMLYDLYICYVHGISTVLKLLDQQNCYDSGNSTTLNVHYYSDGNSSPIPPLCICYGCGVAAIQ